MRSVFARLSKPELDFLTDNIIFNETDKEILTLCAEGLTELQIANKVMLAQSTITKRKRKNRKKIEDFLEVLESMTTVYVNGKRVNKEDLSKMEINIDEVKKVFAEKLAIRTDDKKLTENE